MIGSINGVNLNAYSTPVESVQTAGVSAANTQEVEFSYNPQDQTVMDPVTVNLTTEKGAKAPQTENVRLSRSETLKPNAEGNYVYEAGTREYITANSMAAVQHTVDRMGDIFGQEINFAFGDKQIDLHADAGVDLNAYYSRDEASINFFHDFDPVTHKTVYSGASGEVISHEAGHAILDAVRPDFLETWKADTNGLHEAFGDLTALYMSSQNDEVCKLVAQQTGGDLSKPNILANTGEELGTAINNKYGQNATGGDYVRTMINDWFRSEESGVDAIIDFESAVADPNNPKNLQERYTHSDGSKVGKNAVIAQVYKNRSDIAIRQRISELEAQRDVLTDAQALVGTDTSQLESFSNQITEKHSELLEDIYVKNYALASDLKSDILNLQSKREIVKGSISSYDTKLAEIDSEIARLRSQIPSTGSGSATFRLW